MGEREKEIKDVCVRERERKKMRERMEERK